MILVYGHRSVELTNKLISGECPVCGMKNTTYAFVIQKYAHILWVPLLPLEKETVYVCGHCQKKTGAKKVLPEFNTQGMELLKTVRTPLWTFTLSFFIGAFLAYLLFLGVKDRREQGAQIDKFIESPEVGVRFSAPERKTGSTTYAVDSVKNDSVYMTLYFSEMYDGNVKTWAESLVKTKAELKKMYENKEITSAWK